MIRHLQRVHLLLGGRMEYPCNHCGKPFFEKRDKIRCEGKHTGKLPFQCTYEGCSWQFSTSQLLERHISAVHKKLRPHICDQCGKTFGSRSPLTAHTRIHTGETPYGCEKCQKKFKFQSTRDKHKCILD